MPQKGKATAEEKVRIVEAYLCGEVGWTETYQGAGIGEATLRRWISRYKTEGGSGFLPAERNRSYSKETKRAAVLDYLEGKGSLRQIREKYGIRSSCQLESWIKVYNRHEDFKEY